MTQNGPDFLIVLDQAYAKFLSLGLTTLAHFHPGAKVFLYDLTPAPSVEIQGMSKLYKNIDYIHWPQSKWLENTWVDSLGFSDFHYDYTIRDRIKRLSRMMRYKLLGIRKEGWGELDKTEEVRKKKHFMNLCSQRTVICKDCLERTGNNVVFIDADAIVWRSVDAVFEKDFDVALTMRRLNDMIIDYVPEIHSDRPVPFKVINAGVIYFKNNERSGKFVNLWVEEILKARDFALDQTALAQLVLDADKHAFEGYERDISIGSGSGPISIKLLPCEPYNNFYMRNDFTFETMERDTYIAHFKGYLHRDEYFSSLKRVVEKHIAESKGQI